ncbi:hypothetical protein MPEAHAMD_6760 [Methylobacterium frigidaeris]|uniref:Uncharacterized protein n=1 Tax=Methylobacterium frigidaeris TaxID=2038277 RepID=A0AA37M8U2_9HYPH|nr:hypothetical protein MPEAHAMD_6760 [Methylobacterium frigidaeris]
MHQRPPSLAQRRSPPLPRQLTLHFSLSAKAPTPGAFFVSGVC